MISAYDKVIVVEENSEKKFAVIFDQKTHLPVFYVLSKLGMDELLDVLKSNGEE